MEELFKQRPLRILMTTDTVGGVWSYTIELCKAMLPYNIHFYVITTGAPMQPAQVKEIAGIENATVYETDFLLEWMESPWESIDASAGWLLQVENELKPDLIHINGYAYGALPWQAPVLMVAHSDVFSWWHAVKGEAPPESWQEYFDRVHAGLLGADYLLAPSNAMLQAIRQLYAITTPGAVIYNGRSAEQFRPATKEPFVFSMGRIWDEAKNIQLLVQAAPHINYPVRLAGDQKFATNNNAAPGTNINYLGKLSTTDVAAQLAAASVYVLPAKYEPFGLSILEAALSGCALVLGNIDSLKEIWDDSAFYVDPNNALALAETINYLMNNEAVRSDYAQRALQRAQKYTTKAMAENYRKVYRHLLQPKESALTPIKPQVDYNGHMRF